MATPTQTLSPPAPDAALRSPLGSVLTFTFLNSLGTGAVTSGLYFLTDAAFGFGVWKNFVLGAVMGGTYIIGALAAGPLTRRLAARSSPITSRALVLWLMVALAGLCVLPLGCGLITGQRPAPEWSVWVFGIAYLPLTGLLWPFVEAYLSGGRRGSDLRAATGRFNVVWSLALVVSYWAMSPLLERNALLVILALGAVHLIALLPGWRMGPEPGRHLADAHEPHPPAYVGLLATFRVLLPTSYLVLAALAPYLPRVMDQLGIPLAWQTPLASAWLIARVGVFLLFERWHGWHGRWWVPIAATVVLLASFAAVVLSPLAGEGGRIVLTLGLLALGGAQAVIYLASLYYVLEVGNAEVDAGGTHEALIGVGYTLGPALGVLAVLAVGADSPHLHTLLLSLVAGLAVATSAFAGVRAHRMTRSYL
jgi:hypothetical protein